LWACGRASKHPGDTFLPGMKIGIAYGCHAPGCAVRIMSSKAPEDPSSGSFAFGADQDRPLHADDHTERVARALAQLALDGLHDGHTTKR
jgi:hypothetical protein